MIASLLHSAFNTRQKRSSARKQAARSRGVSLLGAAPRSRRALLRMPLIGVLSLLLVLGASLGSAGPTSALQTHKEVGFSNQTSRTIHLAVVMVEEENCGSEGWIFSAWWTLPPGEERAFSVIGDSFYYHGRADDGGVWDGEDGVDEQITLYASRNNFEWCQYDTNDWLNLTGGGIVDTAAEGYEITLGLIDLAGRSSGGRNFTETGNPGNSVLFD